MKARELENLGVPRGEGVKAAQAGVKAASAAGLTKAQVRARLREVLEAPSSWLEDAAFGVLAALLAASSSPPPVFEERAAPAPWRRWGAELEVDALRQMQDACRLPVSVAGALMPDAHVGYGLPIGGVLATDNAVIPYAVGVDIACRMRLTVTDIPVQALKGETQRLVRILEDETRFGIGATFKKPHDHEVLSEDWGASPVTRVLLGKARAQLGTSGSGNHFVELGVLTLARPELGLEPGQWLAILSHSGSRGAGATVANHFSRLAMDLHPELPSELRRLAWLGLDTPEGQEYWYAMNLMGRYAAANHAVIHRQLVKALKTRALVSVENHHNFAWKEVHDGREVIVHRKGATPAGAGVLGIIPGSMTAPGYVVRGKGSAASLESASHGAGRRMSRTAARSSITWSDVKRQLAERDVHLISAGIDEAPGVYKDIDAVMAEQEDLVETLARFEPRIVKMAPEGEKPED